MVRHIAVLILAFALAALPFGMGSMMAVQAGADHHAAHHFDHHGAAQAHHALHSDHNPGAASRAMETLGLLHLGHADASGIGQMDTDRPDAGAHLHFAACSACLSLPAVLGDTLALRAALPIPELRDPSPLRSLETLPALPPPRA